MIKKSVLFCLGLLSTFQISAQDRTPYTQSRNLQQESIPSTVEKRDSLNSNPYHFRDREEYEIPYGRPVLNPDFSEPERYYDFMTEQVDKFLKNYKEFLLANMNGNTENKLDNIRYSTVQHIQYAAYRYKYIQNADKYESYNKALLESFRELEALYKNDLGKYLSKREIMDKSYHYWTEYYEAETALFDKIHAKAISLIELKKQFDEEYELKNKPDYKMEYNLTELANIQSYRERLYKEYLKVWFKGEEFFRFVNKWDSKGMAKSQELTVAYSKQAALNLKTIDKYKNNITFKNTINKYIKYVQTSSKNTFKKISDIVNKKEDNKANRKTIRDIQITYKLREREYLKQINQYYQDLLSTNLDLAKTDSEKQKLKDLKEREQKEKEAERLKAKQDRWK